MLITHFICHIAAFRNISKNSSYSTLTIYTEPGFVLQYFNLMLMYSTHSIAGAMCIRQCNLH